MSFSDEEIIAFLLGDAEPEVAQRIRASLPNDVELADRVSHFRSVLNHLDSAIEQFEPPSDLIHSTFARIDELTVETSSAECAHPSVRLADSASSLSAPVEPALRRRNWIDSIALTVSLVALCSLAIPAMVRARYESRRSQCSFNLRETGFMLFEYAMRQPDNRFPLVARTGPEAFAGVYVVRLNDSGLKLAPSSLRCASLIGVEKPTVSPVVKNIPTMEQLYAASQQQLECWQCSLGGDYAYNLGVIEEDQLVAPKNLGSSHFAILADAPWLEDDIDQVLAHDGRGMNILYDDGQVRFVRSDWISSKDSIADHPFRNIRGDREAGIGIMDASLAPSQFPPISH